MFVSREEFYLKFKGIRYVQRYTPKPSEGTLMAKRNRRIALAEGGKAHRKIYIRYKKVSGETKVYLVEPYSYRYRRLKAGLRRVLYAWNYDKVKRKGTIKMYVLDGILNVKVTNLRFFPRWRVEF